jgi:hypothetical protein
MDDLEQKMAEIAQSVAAGNYRYTVHGAQQRIARRIRRLEIEQAIASGEIIEDYPQHHYGPACLVMGRSGQGKVLHILCALSPVVAIVTVYEPDPAEWEADWKVRRPRR